MKAQARAILPALLLLPGCGERSPPPEGQGSTTPPYVRAEASEPLLDETVTPVRVGELGPSFAACNARGSARERTGGGDVPVRAAPFEQAQAIDQLGAGAEFFICSRTHDQRWTGIVYDEGGRASERCGVSAPTPERRDYHGPCAAGWVPSARIRLVSGAHHQVPAAMNSSADASAPPPND